MTRNGKYVSRRDANLRRRKIQRSSSRVQSRCSVSKDQNMSLPCETIHRRALTRHRVSIRRRASSQESRLRLNVRSRAINRRRNAGGRQLQGFRHRPIEACLPNAAVSTTGEYDAVKGWSHWHRRHLGTYPGAPVDEAEN